MPLTVVPASVTSGPQSVAVVGAPVTSVQPSVDVAWYCGIDGVPTGVTPTLAVKDASGNAVTPSSGGAAVAVGAGAWSFPFVAPAGLYLGVISAGPATVLVAASRAGIDLSGPLAAPRSLDALADGQVTANDALWCAASLAAGQQGFFVDRELARKTPAGTTTIRTLTLDAGSTTLT